MKRVSFGFQAIEERVTLASEVHSLNVKWRLSKIGFICWIINHFIRFINLFLLRFWSRNCRVLENAIVYHILVLDVHLSRDINVIINEGVGSWVSVFLKLFVFFIQLFFQMGDSFIVLIHWDQLFIELRQTEVITCILIMPKLAPDWTIFPHERIASPFPLQSTWWLGNTCLSSLCTLFY